MLAFGLLALSINLQLQKSQPDYPHPMTEKFISNTWHTDKHMIGAKPKQADASETGLFTSFDSSSSVTILWKTNLYLNLLKHRTVYVSKYYTTNKAE